MRTDVYDDNTWKVDMPLEFGASDWVLFIQWDVSREVSAVAMRTSDDIHSRLYILPEDRGRFTVLTL